MNDNNAISRRSLLKHAMTGAAGAGLALEFGSGWRAEAASEYGPFKMSFQSYSLRHFTQIDDFVRALRAFFLHHATNDTLRL